MVTCKRGWITNNIAKGNISLPSLPKRIIDSNLITNGDPERFVPVKALRLISESRDRNANCHGRRYTVNLAYIFLSSS